MNNGFLIGFINYFVYMKITDSEKDELNDLSVIIHNLTGRKKGHLLTTLESGQIDEPFEIRWLMIRYLNLICRD